MSKPVWVEYDGSSKGNPGKSGAGAVLRDENGSVVARARQGLGNTTNNQAEYEGLKLGLKTAREMGYDHVHVQGDSTLVYKQVQGEWKTKNDNMSRLCSEAQELGGQFKSFKMRNVRREYNSAADTEANKATDLQAGEVYVEHDGYYSVDHHDDYAEYNGDSGEDHSDAGEVYVEHDGHYSVDNHDAGIDYTEHNGDSGEVHSDDGEVYVEHDGHYSVDHHAAGVDYEEHNGDYGHDHSDADEYYEEDGSDYGEGYYESDDD